MHTSRNLAGVQGVPAYQQHTQASAQQHQQRARPSVVQPQQNQRQVVNWVHNKPSFTAPPQTPGTDMSSASGAAGPVTPAGPAAQGKAFPKNPNMPSSSSAIAPSASASAAAPPGSTASRQVRVNPRPSLPMSLAAKPGPGAASSQTGSAHSCAIGRGTSTSALSSPRRAASPVKQHAQQAGSCEAGATSRSRMRYSSAGRSFEQSGPPTGRAVVATQQDPSGSPTATAQRAGARLSAYRSSSTLDGSPSVSGALANEP